MRQQIVGLENEAHVPPAEIRQLCLVQQVDDRAVYADSAGRGRFQSRQLIEQGAFP